MKTILMTKIKPNPFFLFCISVVFGGAFAAGFIWLFGIEISSLERFSVFPEKWTILEFVWNATSGIVFFGAIRATYVALRGHFYGSSSEEPSNPGAG
jgi:hypothetical protein